jgi:hypothetical protein
MRWPQTTQVEADDRSSRGVEGLLELGAEPFTRDGVILEGDEPLMVLGLPFSEVPPHFAVIAAAA